MQEESSSPSGEMLACSRQPMMERRLRPQPEQALKCPRCESTHTKFCYYNNYSLSQPRYFCKTCRRYWTKGGTLRNIPVGGGCRKNNKKVSNKKPTVAVHAQALVPHFTTAGDTHLSFPGVADPQMPPPPHFNSLLAAANGFVPLDFMDSKLDALSYDFMGGGFGSNHMDPSFHGFCTPYGMSTPHLDGDGGGSTSNFNERAMLPYDAGDEDQMNDVDVKPNAKPLSLEWHDQGYNFNGTGPWTGMINGYGCSTSNPLV